MHSISQFIILFGYYIGFATGLVKDINQTRSYLYIGTIFTGTKESKNLRKYSLTAVSKRL